MKKSIVLAAIIAFVLAVFAVGFASADHEGLVGSPAQFCKAINHPNFSACVAFFNSGAHGRSANRVCKANDDFGLSHGQCVNIIKSFL